MLLKILYIVLLILSLQTAGGNLIAQPQIEWYRTYNSPVNADDFAASIAIDSSGNIITFGWIFASGSNGGYVVNKYTPTGQLLWTGRYFEPTGLTIVSKKVAVDALNNIYVTGNNESIVTVKFNSQGVLQWVRKYRGSGSFLNFPNDLKIDKYGFIYVTGESSEPPPSAYDYVTIKYNSKGDSLWTRKYNGPEERLDIAHALEVDALGNVYVTGGSQSYHDSAYYYDITTIKYSNIGATLWVNRHIQTGIGSGIAFDIALDNIGNIYSCGFLQDNNLRERGFLIQYNIFGNINWLNLADSIAIVTDKFNVKVDLFNNVYLVGNGRNYPPGTYVSSKFSNNGTLIWLRSFYPNPPFEAVFEKSIIDNSGSLYITGAHYTVKYDSSGNLMWFFKNIINDSTYVGKSMVISKNGLPPIN